MGDRRPVCDVCCRLFREQYGIREIWDQTYCLSHLDDNTPMCCGCMRLKGNGVEYIDLGDMRWVCPSCYQTAIFDDENFQRVVQKCHEFFNALKLQFKQNIPSYLVDAFEVSNLLSTGATVPMHTNHASYWGLNIKRDRPIEYVKNAKRRGNKMKVTKDTGNGNTYKAAVLFGLPMVKTGALMAHELLHAWFRLQGIPYTELEASVEEGICQVIAHSFLEWIEADSSGAGSSSGGGEQAEYVNKLIKSYKREIETEPGEDYGDGFRNAKAAVDRHGLKLIINYIYSFKTLPPM